ncbi:MAG: response regulator, partial [Verrucomicrobiota bacterium]
VLKMFEARASDNDIKLVGNISDQLPERIKADDQKIRQIVINLLSNAVKFSSGGNVELLVKVADTNKLFISVKDDGSGIAEEEQMLLFKEFSQTAAGRDSKEGSGVGLSICQKLASLMDGEISLESQLGHGATFTVQIPFELQKLPVSAFKEPEPPNDEKEAISGEGKTVLVVDDAPANRLFVSRLLSNLGYAVEQAFDGGQAVEKAQEVHSDLILMDVNMPVMDGFEATRQIREIERNANRDRTPIIALTANAFDEHRRQAEDAGCDGFIAKPFEFTDLIEAIEDVFLAR